MFSVTVLTPWRMYALVILFVSGLLIRNTWFGDCKNRQENNLFLCLNQPIPYSSATNSSWPYVPQKCLLARFGFVANSFLQCSPRCFSLPRSSKILQQ